MTRSIDPTSKRLALLGGLFDSNRMIIAPIHASFLLAKGVCLTDFATLQVVCLATLLCAQVPAGLLSDRLGHKYNTLLACAFLFAFYLFSLLAPAMPYLIAGQVMAGLGLATMSSAIEGWLVNAVKKAYPDQPKQIDYFGHMKKEVTGFGNIFTTLLGTLIAVVWSPEHTYAMAGVMMLFLLLAFLGVPHVTPSQHKGARPAQALPTQYLYLLTQPRSLFFLLGHALLMMAYQPIFHFWTPLFMAFMEQAGLPAFLSEQKTLLLGSNFILLNLAIFLFNRYLRKELSERNPFFVGIGIALIASGCFIGLGLLQAYGVLYFILLFSGLHGAMASLQTILQDQYFKQLPLAAFSSLYAVGASLGHLAGLVTLLAIKQWLYQGQISAIFLAASMPVLLVSLLLLLWHKDQARQQLPRASRPRAGSLVLCTDRPVPAPLNVHQCAEPVLEPRKRQAK